MRFCRSADTCYESLTAIRCLSVIPRPPELLQLSDPNLGENLVGSLKQFGQYGRLRKVQANDSTADLPQRFHAIRDLCSGCSHGHRPSSF